MNLKAVGHRLLVKPDPLKERVKINDDLKKLGFEIARPADMEKMEEAATQTGTVVDVGSTAWHAFDKSSPDWKAWCKVGDRIVFARYAGKPIEDPVTDEKYFVLNDEDVQALVVT